MNLYQIIKNLPDKSGIYQYFDKNLNILYIGKAKSLKKRVKSYFSFVRDSKNVMEFGDTIDSSTDCDGLDSNKIQVVPAKNLSPRIESMVRKIAQIRTIIVDSEQDALILENSLIKSLKPKYNILLRDDKTYPYILIDKRADFPRLEVVRKITNDKNLLYFGPYSSGIKEVVDSIYEIVPLVQKKSCLREKKPCLFYQIKRCHAPCANLISQSEYQKHLDSAIHLLNNPSKILTHLTQKMHDLAADLKFEDANKLKIRIQKIKQTMSVSTIDLAKLYNFDIFAIKSKGNKSVLLKLFMRDGRVIFSDYNIISHNDNDADLDYLYTQGLINHYKNNPPLKLDSILLPITLCDTAELLSITKTKILTPKSGEKLKLVNLALNNAQNILDNNNEFEILEKLKILLRLQNLPQRIEVFDTSHHGGSNIVGGMIVFENNDFRKDSYRKFNLCGRDEYSQMTEMFERRVAKFDENPPPDLWLIDGGLGQINVAKKILESSGVEIDIVAIAKEKIDSKAHRAKGGAMDILRDKDGREIRLDKNDKRLQFLQKLRDEAHRYAITFHRKKKTKSIQDSKYTKPQLKKLLNYFGSFEAINNADEAMIGEVLKKRNL